MKIKEVTKATIFHVETDDDFYCMYIRYGKGCWMITMGESDELIYNDEELEKLFQDYLSENNIKLEEGE